MAIENGKTITDVVGLYHADMSLLGEVKYFWSMIERFCGYKTDWQSLSVPIAKIANAENKDIEASVLYKILCTIEKHAKNVCGDTTDALKRYADFLLAREKEPAKCEDKKAILRLFDFRKKAFDAGSSYAKQTNADYLDDNQKKLYEREYLIDFLVFVKHFQSATFYDYEHLNDLLNPYRYDGEKCVKRIANLLKYLLNGDRFILN